MSERYSNSLGVEPVEPRPLEATRRRLSGKQADTVDRLTRAALAVLGREGYSGMTIRIVAAEAGVGAATAYTYFSSKEHLVAEIFWRRLQASQHAATPDPAAQHPAAPDTSTPDRTPPVTTAPHTTTPGTTAPDATAPDTTAHDPVTPEAARVARVVTELRDIALLVADEPELSGAVTSALLGRDPDVQHLRLRIGLAIRSRISAALGPDPDPEVIESLELIYAGALMRAGMGHESYTDIADRIERSALRVLR
ncbi:TetR family transcriptional regulator [Nocardia farcinica]|uniref:TetR family transcriptional regulator n=1 Tax=Nocardia farcinica TaxID=37329 RepID=UPI002456AEC8|nr:TetR family transcriptional regulator [Nocardia farcinica]